jgi:hypothetical protein
MLDSQSQRMAYTEAPSDATRDALPKLSDCTGPVHGAVTRVVHAVPWLASPHYLGGVARLTAIALSASAHAACRALVAALTEGCLDVPARTLQTMSR